MSIQLQIEGRRTYIIGNTYAFRDQIRAIGAHWDAGRKAWWTAKRAEAEALVAALVSTPVVADTAASTPASKAPRDGADSMVAGRVEYKGKTYYLAGRIARGRTHWDDRVEPVVTQDGSKALLIFRDASSQFWAPREATSMVKRYDKPQTINGLKRFADQQKKAEANGENPCWMCRREEERGNIRMHLHDGCEVCGAEG
jgi:hypothetical protein